LSKRSKITLVEQTTVLCVRKQDRIPCSTDLTWTVQFSASNTWAGEFSQCRLQRLFFAYKNFVSASGYTRANPNAEVF
jgi:hypothetical protein